MDTYGKGTSLGRILIYILFISIAALLTWNFFKNSNFGKGPNYTSVPTEMQINYVPSDFEFNADDETTLAILTNPARYKREFDDLVYNFNLTLINHVATRMNLPDSIKMELEPEYKKTHKLYRQLYYNDFVKIRDTTANLHESWYADNAGNATAALNEVASKHTCHLVTNVIMSVLESKDGKIVGIGNGVDTPCGIALTEGLRPMIRRLQDKAAIMDFSASQDMMEEKVERAIAELATMEIRDRKGINKQLQTKIWGYAVSSTDIEVSAISVLKVGFKLDQYFDIKLDAGRKRVNVTLPKPIILSHEVYPRVDKLEVGWMRELDKNDLNKNINVLRREFRRDAMEDHVMEKAEIQAKELMQLMMQPIISQLGRRYKLRILFKETEESIEDRELANEYYENQETNVENFD